MNDLSVTIVAYQPDCERLAATLESLESSASVLKVQRGYVSSVYVVDNSPVSNIGSLESRFDGWIRFKSGQGNVGFGQGQNLCLGDAGSFHLVLNPDVELAADALVNAIDFMNLHPDCVLLSPTAVWGNGAQQYLCKRYPSVLDLVLRGFAPLWLRRLFSSRLDRYEMRDVIGNDVVWGPRIVSGCFMLLRGEVFRRLGGFDPRFFLYFEDFDLSLRAATIGRIAYVPAVRIVHHGGNAARKGWWHIWMFACSAWRFFNKHGWRFW